MIRTNLCFYNEISDLFYLITRYVVEFGNVFSLNHPPVNNNLEIFAPLDFSADAPALR